LGPNRPTCKHCKNHGHDEASYYELSAIHTTGVPTTMDKEDVRAKETEGIKTAMAEVEAWAAK